MSTLLAQVEPCLNSRSLRVLLDLDNVSALIPGHFLIGSIPESSYKDISINRLTRWQLFQNMWDHFWERWSSEYLQALILDQSGGSRAIKFKWNASVVT